MTEGKFYIKALEKVQAIIDEKGEISDKERDSIMDRVHPDFLRDPDPDEFLGDY